MLNRFHSLALLSCLFNYLPAQDYAEGEYGVVYDRATVPEYEVRAGMIYDQPSSSQYDDTPDGRIYDQTYDRTRNYNYEGRSAVVYDKSVLPQYDNGTITVYDRNLSPHESTQSAVYSDGRFLPPFGVDAEGYPSQPLSQNGQQYAPNGNGSAAQKKSPASECEPRRKKGLLCDFDTLAKARIDVGYAAGRWISLRSNYAEIGLFLPVYSSETRLLFADGRGYRFDKTKKWGASAGTGFRIDKECMGIFGANFYYDFLGAQCSTSFNRLGFGLEWFGECFEARFNAYFPIGTQSHTFTDCEGNQCHLTALFEKEQFSICKGFDAEIGIPFCCSDCFDVFAGIGPYYYDPQKCLNNFWGGQARIEISLGTMLMLEFKGSYDKINKSRGLAKIQLSLPFEFFMDNFDCFCSEALFQPVRRNGVIFTKTNCQFLEWTR